MPKTKRKKIRKLSVQEKQKRKEAHLLKNKISLVEFVSRHPKIKEEPPDEEPNDLETIADDAFKSESEQETTANESYILETEETNALDASDCETSEREDDGRKRTRTDLMRARQRIYSKKWRQKPENKDKIRLYKKSVREKLKAAKKIAKLEKAKEKLKAKMSYNKTRQRSIQFK